MIIDTEANLLYCRIPKTGSGSLCKWLEENRNIEVCYPVHMTMLEANTLVTCSDYISFGVIRHPIDWVLSVFNHARDGGGDWQDNTGIPYDPSWSFLEFCKRLYTFPDDWLRDLSGKIMVDKVFKYEEMETELLPWLSEMLKQTVTLGRLNEGSKWNDRAEHTNETRRIIESKSARIMSQFYQ